MKHQFVTISEGKKQSMLIYNFHIGGIDVQTRKSIELSGTKDFTVIKKPKLSY